MTRDNVQRSPPPPGMRASLIAYGLPLLLTVASRAQPEVHRDELEMKPRIDAAIEKGVDWVTGLIEHARTNGITRVEADADADRTPVMGSETISWPRFLLILFAHGWFVRAKAFPLGREADTPSVSPRKMMQRVYGFVAIWIAIFALLPIGWSAALAALWLALMTPGIIEIHRQFQNEPDTY